MWLVFVKKWSIWYFLDLISGGLLDRVPDWSHLVRFLEKVCPRSTSWISFWMCVMGKVRSEGVLRGT